MNKEDLTPDQLTLTLSPGTPRSPIWLSKDCYFLKWGGGPVLFLHKRTNLALRKTQPGLLPT